jgi:hypothetical protein
MHARPRFRRNRAVATYEIQQRPRGFGISPMEHVFSLILSGVGEEDFTSELADKLYEATHGDIEFLICDEVARLDFRRSAASLSAAVRSAIEDVRHANVGVWVAEVRIEDLDAINADLAKSMHD